VDFGQRSWKAGTRNKGNRTVAWMYRAPIGYLRPLPAKAAVTPSPINTPPVT